MRFFIAKISFVLNLTKVERGKLKSNLRIALWVKPKMAAIMSGFLIAGLSQQNPLVNKVLKRFEAKVFELLT